MENTLESIKEKLEEITDAKVSMIQLNTNSSKLLMQSKKQEGSLILSVDKYLAECKRGKSIEEIAKKIADVYDEGSNKVSNNKVIDQIDIDINDPVITETFEKTYLLSNIFYRVMSLENNKSYLEDKYHMDILGDIAVVLCVPLKNKERIYFTLTNKVIQTLGIDIEILIDNAWVNTINRIGLYNLDDLEYKGLEKEVNEMDIDKKLELRSGEFYSICSHDYCYGSGIIMCKYYLDKLCENASEGIGIIPLSVHEIMVFKLNDRINIQHVKDMIKQVNSTSACISENTFLSNNLFYYTPKRGLRIYKGSSI